MKTRLLIAVALTALVGRAAVAAEADLAKLSWLEGCWASAGGEPGSGERWMRAGEDGLVGISSKGKTVESERMAIGYFPDGKLAFAAHPSGQASAVFSLLRIYEVEIVFENLEHDFPQRVAYARDGEWNLRARIEGTQGRALRVIELPMTRTSCD